MYTIDTNTYFYEYETYGRQSGKTEKVEKKQEMTKQQQIDKEVAEALEVPRREAEVKRRVEIATAIGEDTYEVGTVFRWKRKFGEKTYSYAAIKAGNSQWFVTGQNQSSAFGYQWDDLVQWMVTGENVIEELEVVDVWKSVVQ